MSDFDPENDDAAAFIDASPEVDSNYSSEMYKKWFKSGTRQGFLSIVPWVEDADHTVGAGKISIDIGELESGKLKSHTQVWANVMDLSTFLYSVWMGTAEKLYPIREKGGLPTPESFSYYGGSIMDKKPVSRILKIHRWGTGKDSPYDLNSFVWKTGHFEAKRSSTGAFIPDMDKPISANLIKVTRVEMAEISNRLQLTLAGHSSRHKEWFNWKKR